MKAFEDDIDFMVKICEKLPDFEKEEKGQFVDEVGHIAEQQPEVARGAALRSLREFLNIKDSSRTWGNLRLILTPEGHYLWLCEYHAKSYAPTAG